MLPLKIAYILTPVDFAGAEKVSLNFLKSINRNRFDICPIILVRPWENFNLFIEEIKRVNYHYLTIPVALKPLSEGKDYFRVFRCFKILFSILRRHKYDIIHSNGYFADILGVPAAKIFGIPHVSTCHGYIATDRSLAIYNALDRFFLRFSTKIIAVSDTIKIALINSCVKESRVKVIKNAVPTDIDSVLFVKNRQEIRHLLGIDDNDFVVGYIGRLSEEKGIKHLIEASSMLIGIGVSLRVLIIGDGPSKKQLEELVRTERIESRVIFPGFKKDVENWMPGIDVFVLPSLTEGTPMALLEAMSFGIPVVASGVGGIPEVIESAKNGILVSPGEPDEIVNAVLTVCKNDGFRAGLSKMAKETIRDRFNLNEWVKKIELVYSEIISTQNSHR